MRHRRIARLAVLLVALLAVAACTTTASSASSASGTATTSARTRACNGLAMINGALTSLASLNANTTVGEVKAAKTEISNAPNAIDRLIPSASGDLLNQIKSANAQLAAAIQGYPDSTPIGQTSANIQNLKATVANAQSKTTQLTSRLNCPP